MYKLIGNDQKDGPVSVEQIREWLTQGRLNRQTQVQVAGASDWKLLGTVAEFRNFFGAAGVPPVVTPTAPSPSDGGINVIIPYKNMRALCAYYLAVFSLIPFLGIALGLAAFVLGLLGLRFRREHPTAGGVVHAWIGIILGGLCGFGWLAVTLIFVFSVVKHR